MIGIMFDLLKMTNRKSRCGFTVMELLAAMTIVGVCMGVFAKLYSMSLAQRQTDRTQQLATDQLQNIFEMLAPLDAEQWAAGKVDVSKQAEMIQRTLPNGKFTVACEPHEQINGLWLLKGTVTWSNGEKQTPHSVSLVRLLSVTPPAPPPAVPDNVSENVAPDNALNNTPDNVPDRAEPAPEEGGDAS